MAKEVKKLPSLSDDLLSLNLNDLSTPELIEKIFLGIKSFSSKKRVVGLADLNILLEKSHLKEDITEKIAEAILVADQQQALDIWEMCAADLKYTMLLPDIGKVNLGIIEKLEIEGDVIRTAFLSKKNFAYPRETAYTKIYGHYSYEDAEELAFILEQIWTSDYLYGKVTVQEFFKEIDLRILYLIGVKEIEQFLSNGGDDVYLAIRANDQLPIGLNFLCWLQFRMPEKYKELIPELINPIYPEFRKMFWETFFRMEVPHVDPDNFSQKVDVKPTYAEDKYRSNDDPYNMELSEELYENELDDHLKIED